MYNLPAALLALLSLLLAAGVRNAPYPALECLTYLQEQRQYNAVHVTSAPTAITAVHAASTS
jgi:hypothetical protein